MYDIRVLRLSGFFYFGEKELVLILLKKVVSVIEIFFFIIKKGVFIVEMVC